MKLGTLLVLVMGLAAVAFATRYALTSGAPAVAGQTAPKRQLDNVRDRAKELEKEQQRQVDDIARKSGDGQ